MNNNKKIRTKHFVIKTRKPLVSSRQSSKGGQKAKSFDFDGHIIPSMSYDNNSVALRRSEPYKYKRISRTPSITNNLADSLSHHDNTQLLERIKKGAEAVGELIINKKFHKSNSVSSMPKSQQSLHQETVRRRGRVKSINKQKSMTGGNHVYLSRPKRNSFSRAERANILTNILGVKDSNSHHQMSRHESVQHIRDIEKIRHFRTPNNVGRKKFTSFNTRRRRMTIRASKLTKKGYNPVVDKPNQDCCLIHEFEAKKGSTIRLFIVADGHGTNGHFISEIVVDSLKGFLEPELIRNKDNLNNKECIKAIIKEACKKAEEEVSKSGIRFSFSGTTLVFALIIKRWLYLCNIGDSRAILASKLKNRICSTLHTVDHSPELKEERKRIEAANGIVSPLIDDDGTTYGPFRVWNEVMTEPGLAMSRSIGDSRAHGLGVSAEPDIYCKKLTHDDKFLILASDGVWECFSTKSSISRVLPLYASNKIAEACKALVKDSARHWDKYEDTRDDITCIVAFIF